MSNKTEEINFKKLYVLFFFEDIVNTKNLDLNKIKKDGNSYKNILAYHIEYICGDQRTLSMQQLIVLILYTLL